MTFLGTKEAQVVKLKEIVHVTIFNLLANLFFSKDLINLDDHEYKASRLIEPFRKLEELATRPNLVDVYPKLEVFDVQGIRKETPQCVNKVFGEWEDLIKDRRESLTNCATKECTDFLDVLICILPVFNLYRTSQIIYHAGGLPSIKPTYTISATPK